MLERKQNLSCKPIRDTTWYWDSKPGYHSISAGTYDGNNEGDLLMTLLFDELCMVTMDTSKVNKFITNFPV